MKNKLFILAILAANFSHSFADTITSSTKATAQLSSSCQFSVENISFGDITPTGTTDIGWTSTTNTIGNLNIQCTNGTSYAIALSLGANYIGGYRYLENSSANQAQYTICQTNVLNIGALSCGKTWKSGTDRYSSKGTGSSQNIPMYAFIKKGYYPPGDYSDIVTATVSY